MLGGKPLLAHAIETALDSNVFSDVYVLSEAEVFRRVAERYGATFYQRPSEFSTDEATNDQFVLDFIEHVACEVLVQLNLTSPFVETEDMRRAVAMFDNDGADTVLTVKETQIGIDIQGKSMH